MRALLGLALLVLMPAAMAVIPENAEPAILDVTLNGAAAFAGVTFWKEGAALAAEPSEWIRLGIVLTSAELARVSLTSEHLGIVAMVDEKLSTANFTVPATRMPLQELHVSGRSAAPIAAIAPGVIVNYDLQGITGRDRQGISLAHEARLGTRAGVLVTSGQLNWKSDDGADYLRGRTYFQRDNEKTKRSVQIGDVEAGGPMGGAILGGVRITRDPSGLDPMRPLYAVPTIGGLAVDAGTLQVLSGQSRLLERPVSKGPFELDRAPLTAGRNEIDLVLRDQFGRETSLGSQSFYFAPSLLAKGEHEWDVSAGAVREGYTNRYGELASSASGRYGLSDSWTLNGSAQISGDKHNASAGVSTVIGHAGTVHLEAGSSSGPQGTGYRFSGSYEYHGPTVSLSIVHKLDSNYWDLSQSDPWAVQARSFTRAQLSLRSPETRITGRVGYTDIQPEGMERTRFIDTAANWSGGNNSVQLGAAYDLETGGTSASLTYRHTFGNGLRSTASVRAAPDAYQARLAIEGRAKTKAGRVMWGIEGTRDDRGSRLLQARSNLFTENGTARLVATTSNGATSASGGFSGAVYIGEGGAQFLPTTDSFAVVRIPGVAGVPVKLNNRVVGKTNKAGVLAVAPMAPLVASRISLDDKEIPIGVQIESTEKWTAARRKAGALVEFPVSSMEAWIFRVQQGGKDVEPGSVAKSSSEEGQVGFGGELFLQHAKAGQQLAITTKAGSCSVQLPTTLPAYSEMPVLECN